MSFPSQNPRQGRFSTVEQSGVEAGLQESGQQDPLNKKFIARNLKPFKTLKRFATVKGLRKLKGKHMGQLERIAAQAVIKKAKVKSKPLNTKVNTKKHKPRHIRQARRQLKRIGPDSFRAGSTSGIKNKRVRRAANHLRQIRRNRAVNRTKVGDPRAYDIFKGYRRR
jgi:hypothetical protein